MAMTTLSSACVVQLLSLVSLSLAYRCKCEALGSQVWESSNLGGYEAEIQPSQKASQNEEGV